ncbi:SDR family NAD(P)-dependent oxidoreductase [Cytophagaceae bacterium DM2B3-1]|uniref:SDR family NAD(P)-dependent oxidoreductase n=1 Tax=Xanthocytophaga flava TaxID=3048013 RepID=A0ABT7CMA5_9BACT|nr:SDR family NAD(P)-dependent oxidoreductase [Xanthocytophaga flavus]MDJ1494817.1 SDR family NAD(P)-dependent oxidoreductase [Xanthocytophaga flavus]
MELKNSTILITGGTSGIGLEFVKQLTQQRANIIITGRNLDKLNETKRQFPQVAIFQSDVSNPKDIEALYQKVTRQFPDLNIIINNAGIMRNLSLHDTSMSLENITAELDIDLSGVIQMNHQFLPHLKTQQSAAIVNISSGLAFIPFPVSPIYSAAKAGLHAYTRVLRLQLKNTPVKVFEIAPPATDTSLGDAFTGLVDPSMNMKVDKMVSQSIQGLLKDNLEIKPGMSKMMKTLGRFAPDFALNFMHSSIEKARRNK